MGILILITILEVLLLPFRVIFDLVGKYNGSGPSDRRNENHHRYW